MNRSRWVFGDRFNRRDQTWLESHCWRCGTTEHQSCEIHAGLKAESGWPKFVGRMPIRQDIYVIPATPTNVEVNWNGFELLNPISNVQPPMVISHMDRVNYLFNPVSGLTYESIGSNGKLLDTEDTR